MPRLLAAALVLACFLPAPLFAQDRLRNDDRRQDADLRAAAREISENLRDAGDLLRNIPDIRTREKLELLIGRAERRALEIERQLDRGAGGRPLHVPASAEDFAKLLKGVKAQGFDDGKLTYLTPFLAKGHLTCDQAKELLKTFSFDDGKEDAAVALFSRLTDPENFASALDVFSFDSSKEDVLKRLKLK